MGIFLIVVKSIGVIIIYLSVLVIILGIHNEDEAAIYGYGLSEFLSGIGILTSKSLFQEKQYILLYVSIALTICATVLACIQYKKYIKDISNN